jgi:hypothetical protein
MHGRSLRFLPVSETCGSAPDLGGLSSLEKGSPSIDVRFREKTRRGRDQHLGSNSSSPIFPIHCDDTGIHA